MTDKTIDLDRHRGMAAQKATELRRLLADVEADERALRLRQDELESHLLAAPAVDWYEAAEKARYLLKLFGASLAGRDPRRQTLIEAVLADFGRGTEPTVDLLVGADADRSPAHEVGLSFGVLLRRPTAPPLPR